MLLRKKTEKTTKSLFNVFVAVAAYMISIPFAAEILDKLIIPYLTNHLPSGTGLPTNINGLGSTAAQINYMKSVYLHLLHKNPRQSGDDVVSLKQAEPLATQSNSYFPESPHGFFKVAHASREADANMPRCTKSSPGYNS